jgi:hypothetical protein
MVGPPVHGTENETTGLETHHLLKVECEQRKLAYTLPSLRTSQYVPSKEKSAPSHGSWDDTTGKSNSPRNPITDPSYRFRVTSPILTLALSRISGDDGPQREYHHVDFSSDQWPSAVMS